MSFRAAALVTAGLLLLAGCAARAPLAETPDAHAAEEIEALVRRGCYECLRSAFSRALDNQLTEHAYEAALLLAARSKELGLPYTEWVSTAQTTRPASDEWHTYLDIVLALPIDPLSGDRERAMLEAAQYRRMPAVLDAWRIELRGGPASAIFRAYLELSLACGPRLFEMRDEVREEVLRQHPGVPLLQYRAGICGRASLLQEIRHPDFVDAEFELGRAALARDRADEDEALGHFRIAHEAFPKSPLILVALGTLLERREDWAGALEAYEAALQLTPTHRDALLGRTIGLSRLGRHDDAIASASTLIELGAWFMGEAYYWRAWNRYQQGELSPARADVDASKAVSPAPGTLVLSGIIAWRENRLAVADAELSSALERDFGYCEAALYLGFVRADDRRWADSLAALDHADRCFALTVDASQQAIAHLSGTDEDARTNARQIASHRRAIADAEARRATVMDTTSSVRRHLDGNGIPQRQVR